VAEHLSASFDLGELEADGHCYVTGTVKFPDEVTGVAFSVPFRRRVPNGISHWLVVREALQQLSERFGGLACRLGK